MNTSGENWKVLLSLLPAGWQQAALEFGAVKRLRGFASPEALLRTLLLHVGLGYSLRETVVRARLADWADVSDVALLKRMRNSEQWLRFLCISLLRESGVFVLDKTVGAVRVVDGTIVKEPGRTGSQWRILYSLQLPSLLCDFLEVTASGGEGNGESLNRLSVARHELILADAGYCSVAGIEYVQQRGADVLVRVNPQAFVAYSQQGRRFNLATQLRRRSQTGQVGEWPVTLHGPTSSFRGRVCAVRKSKHAIEQAHRRLRRKASKKQMSTRPETLEVAKCVVVFTTRNNVSAAEILDWYRSRWQIGVSSQGHVNQPVQVRPRLTDSSLVAWEGASWSESETTKPSDNILRKEYAQLTRLQRAVNADVASSHANPEAETVDNVRKQQEPIETSPMRRLSPAGYQRRHGEKENVETGEAPGVRRRNLVEEATANNREWEVQAQAPGWRIGSQYWRWTCSKTRPEERARTGEYSARQSEAGVR